MHELLLEKIVEECRAYSDAMSDCHPLPKIGAETAVMAIAQIAKERDELKEKIARLTKPVAVTR